MALLYGLRLDDVFYFLHGAEGQGLLLAQALADGHGFVDLSLPGHPAHVREPPLFYLTLAGLIKLFGFRLLPMKIFMWASYVAAAVLGTAFFQRRSRPIIALAAVVLCFSTPEFFRFFTGPKSDLPFMVLVFAALLAGDRFLEQLFQKTPWAASRVEGPGTSRSTLLFSAVLTAVFIIAAIFTRSLALSLLLAMIAVLVAHTRKPWRSRLSWLIIISAPVLMAVGWWVWRGARVPNPAGYSYLDWFLMNLPPDSPAMTAVDFHAPLLGPIPRASALELLLRVGRHALMYPAIVLGSLFNSNLFSWLSVRNSNFLWLGFILFLIAASAFIYWIEERQQTPFTLFYLLIYYCAVMVWPMDDPRLLYPLLPFVAYYGWLGVDLCPDLFMAVIRTLSRNAGFGPSERTRVFLRQGFLVISGLALFTPHVAGDLKYYYALANLSTITFQPGFRVRFMNAETRDSYRLLRWASENTPPEAVLMYHSPPPCRLFTGHDCRSIPFSSDLARVREFIVNGGADYLILDEWSRVSPTRVGQFVDTTLRPLSRQYPNDFITVFRLPGTGAEIVQVRKPVSSPSP